MARTILLADDSMTIQKVVELTFMDEDYQVVAVSDGTVAIQKLSEMRPDLLITDVHMPGANGYDVCRHAKANLPGLPVLLLVGTFEQFDGEEAGACGADGHLKKPFDSQELLNRVEALVTASQSGVATPVVSEVEPMVLPSAMPQQARVLEMPVASPSPSMAPVAPLAPAAPTSSATDSGQGAPENLFRAGEGPRPPAIETADTRPMAAKPVSSAIESGSSESDSALSESDVDRIARRVVELLGDKVLREVSWDVLPDLAEVVIRERIHELERQVESA